MLQKSKRSRKKLEKSVKDAKDEISTLTERLKTSQAELGIRDDRIQQLMKQVEIKSNELSLAHKVTFSAFKRL
jgi:septal ring factor EnvC (AmiA/AmiB activator)